MLEIINGTKKYGGKTVLNNINYNKLGRLFSPAL